MEWDITVAANIPCVYSTHITGKVCQVRVRVNKIIIQAGAAVQKHCYSLPY